MIETHAHIFAEQFDEDRDDVIERAVEEGVERIYMPNIDSTSVDRMMEAEERYDSCIATIGLHPCSVQKDFEKELYVVEDWLSKRSFAAIGEAGIDLYWDKTYQKQQEEALAIQLEWAKKYRIPIILHCRDSFEETLALVEKHNSDELTGVFHCFTGSAADAQKVADQGFKIGLGGVATFKNGGLREVIPALDLNTIVVETDAPYLAPTPKRGKRNEPAFIKFVAQKIADLKEMPLEEVIDITTKNANDLFQYKG